MRVSYERVIEDVIDLPDMVGINTPDGVKMLYCEEIEDSDYHVARYQTEVVGDIIKVDIYKDVSDDGDTIFNIYSKRSDGDRPGEIIGRETAEPYDILDKLGNIFSGIEKDLSVDNEKKINVNLNIDNISEVKRQLTKILDIL